MRGVIMVKTKPFVIEYKQPRVLIGNEFVDSNGEIFNSPNALREAGLNNNLQMNPIIFCHACGAGNRHDVWGFPNTPNANRYKKHNGQCPNCGERLTLEYSYDIANAKAHSGNNTIAVSRVRGKSPTEFPTALKWWPISDGKLAIETVMDMYFSRTMHGQYWLQHETLRYRYIFNVDTGMSYSMRGIDAKGNPSKYSSQTHRLQNRTFRSMDTIHYSMSNDFIEIVLSALQEHKGLQYTKTMEKSRWSNELGPVYSCHNHKIGYSMLGWINYFSGMKANDIGDMLEMTNQDIAASTKKYFKNLISLSRDGEVEWLPKYMQKRSIRRRLKKRAVAFFMYKWLYACGIRDVNIMNNIVDDYLDVVPDSTIRKLTDKLSLGEIVARHCINASQESVDFMKWALKGRSAESVYQFVTGALTSNSFLLNDSARMYKIVTSKYLPDNAGNIKELHDALVVADRKLRYGNREIEHTAVEKALEMDKGGYSFRLAKDTDTLYDIGKALSICVGSYGRDAVAKHCTIMTMSKDDKYVACIELRVNKKNVQMVQLKSRFNHTVKDIEPITEWVMTTGINAQCYDYQTAIEHKDNGFNNRNRDYHVENPRLRIDNDFAFNDVFDQAFPF